MCSHCHLIKPGLSHLLMNLTESAWEEQVFVLYIGTCLTSYLRHKVESFERASAPQRVLWLLGADEHLLSRIMTSVAAEPCSSFKAAALFQNKLH